MDVACYWSHVCLPCAGGAAVLSGPEEQSRVSEGAGDVRLEPGGGQHPNVRQLRIHDQTEVPSHDSTHDQKTF